MKEIIQAVQDTAYSLSVNPSSAEGDLRILKDALVSYFIVKDVGATLIYTDKAPERVYPKNGSDFQLEEAQTMVDGNVEVIPLHDDSGYIMIINDEGKFTKEPNPIATDIARKAKGISRKDYICGNVILCFTSMFR